MSEKSKGELFAEACDAWADWRDNNRGGCSPDERLEEGKAWSRVFGYFEDAEKEVERLRAALTQSVDRVKELLAENAALKENASATLYHEALRLKREFAELRDENVVLVEKASEACDALREIERVDGEELAALKAENAELRERCKAIAADADNWKRLACTSDRDLAKPVAREMDAAEREHYERGKDITGCDV